jgi:hypothetical protein
LLVLASVAVVVAVAAADFGWGGATAGAQATTPTPTAAAAGREPGVFTPAPAPPAAPDTGDPVTLTIEAAGVRAELDRVRLGPSGEIEPPQRWQVPGWYADGPVPGERGPAVVLGHVDSPDGPAVFARLDELGPGDRVEVGLADGSFAVFVVDRSVTVPQQGFPTAEVYGPTPDAQLRLITCDGAYDRAAGRYLHNLVVFATLATG